MQNGKKALITLGVVLIIVQVISLIGMSKMDVGLYPDIDDLFYPSYSRDTSGLNLNKVLFAIEAGTDRFKSSFEDLTYDKYEYRVMSATQMTSAMVRESLGCSEGGTFGLVIYDTVLTISYSAVGWLGVGVLVALIINLKLEEDKKWKAYWEEKRKARETQEKQSGA